MIYKWKLKPPPLNFDDREFLMKIGLICLQIKSRSRYALKPELIKYTFILIFKKYHQILF